jgi:hypothetical protein
VYHAVDELANLENDNKLAYIAVALHYLKGAIIRGDRKYVTRAAEEAKQLASFSLGWGEWLTG